MKNKEKRKTWWQLKHLKCPKCNGELQGDMFGMKLLGCGACGFLVTEETRNVLVKRDHSDNK